MTDSVRFQMITNQIGLITLDQAGRRNAFTVEMWEDLSQAIEDAAADPDLKVLILEGAAKNFAHGSEISEFAAIYESTDTTQVVTKLIADTLNALDQFPKPTIAKIRGFCIGAGLELALCCDIRISDGTGLFAMTTGSLGLVPSFPNVKRLIEAGGLNIAKDMLYSCRQIKASEALNVGILNHMCDQYELDDAVRQYALAVCSKSGTSAQATKMLLTIYEAGQRGETATTRELHTNGFSSDDFTEAYAAFTEKRTPRF